MAQMNAREARHRPVSDAIKYDDMDAGGWTEQFCDDSQSLGERAKYIPVLQQLFTRETRLCDPRLCEQLLDAGFAAMDELGELASERQLELFLLLAQCLLQPKAAFDEPRFAELAGSAITFLLRDRVLREDSGAMNRLLSSLALCAGVSQARTCEYFTPLVRLADATRDAASRGLVLRFGAQVAASTQDQVALAPLIATALESPSEALLISAIRAAAVFLERFGDASPLDASLLEVDYPTPAQVAAGVSRGAVARECGDVLSFVHSDSGAKPSTCITLVGPSWARPELVVTGFFNIEILRQLTVTYTTLTQWQGGLARVYEGVFLLRELPTRSRTSIDEDRAAKSAQRERERADDREARESMMRRESTS
jgi:hypothetical protein